MQVKNHSNSDITFMYKSPRSTETMPIFDTVNIVAGWTVLINDKIWDEISKQTKTINMFKEEVVDIEGATMKDINGKLYTPKKTIRLYSHSEEVNVVEQYIKDRVLEIIKTDDEPVLPKRSVLEAFLKRFGEKGVDKLSDEDLLIKVKELKAELAAVEMI